MVDYYKEEENEDEDDKEGHLGNEDDAGSDARMLRKIKGTKDDQVYCSQCI